MSNRLPAQGWEWGAAVNFFGVGFLELTVIFLVAFLVLGPGKSIEMARTAGKLLGDLRRTLNELTAAASLTPENPPPARPSSAPSPATPSPEPPPPSGAVPTTGPGDGNEQQP